jgi:hypothetical protein
VFPDLDYAGLRRSFEYFVEHYPAAALVTPDAGLSTWRLQTFVEGTQDFCRERVAEIDRDLYKRDAYTLSFLARLLHKRSKGKYLMFDARCLM